MVPPRVFGVIALLWTGLMPAAGGEEGVKQAPFRYDAKGRRDPFTALVRDGRPVGSISGGLHVGAEKPVLYGILWDPGGRSIALINDAEVKVGDAIGGYQVSEIREDSVVLINGGEPVVLQIAFEASSSTLSPGTTTGGEDR